ncbi:MAG: cytochrome c peroxidase [Myxococcales bacterium]|nr:cytochrome c peroxidase [Myxococcales bacterium]
MTPATLLILVALTGSPRATLESEARAFAAAYRRPAPLPPAPREQVELGRLLFFDPRLSGSGTMSCASCHNPSLSWGDGLARGVGAGGKALARRTPTVLDVAWGQTFMWDGRFETLEAQALSPVTSVDEMNLPEPLLAPRVAAVGRYRQGFERAFPDAGVSTTTIAKALASFERTVVSGKAPFDRWVDGERSAISDAARRGFVLFNTRAKCSKCHSGWRFTDESFHDIGVADADLGRGALPEFTKFTVLQHAFKTPSLRDTARRGPWMHDGSAKTLEEVIQLYDVGGIVKRPSLSADLTPLSLSPQDEQDLIELMKTFSAPVEVAVPVLPRE